MKRWISENIGDTYWRQSLFLFWLRFRISTNIEKHIHLIHIGRTLKYLFPLWVAIRRQLQQQKHLFFSYSYSQEQLTGVDTTWWPYTQYFYPFQYPWQIRNQLIWFIGLKDLPWHFKVWYLYAWYLLNADSLNLNKFESWFFWCYFNPNFCCKCCGSTYNIDLDSFGRTKRQGTCCLGWQNNLQEELYWDVCINVRFLFIWTLHNFLVHFLGILL